jgi:hypothetical protein
MAIIEEGLGMANSFSRQIVTQAAMSVALLTLLGIIFVVGPQYEGDSLDEFIRPGLGALARSSRDAASSKAKLKELQTLPAYQDIEQSLGQLEIVRSALLDAAAIGDADAMLFAGAEYYRTLEWVRSDLGQLEAFLDPRDYQLCLQALYSSPVELGRSSQVIQESRLKILPPVNILPETMP